MTSDDDNSGPILKQVHKCGGVKSVSVIPILIPLFNNCIPIYINKHEVTAIHIYKHEAYHQNINAEIEIKCHCSQFLKSLKT